MSVDTGARADVVGEHQPTPVAYRYPGSPPFGDTDLDRRLFEGRPSEIEAVLHSILNSNVFVLYALSGLGKTSLLNAGVMPQLRARGHWPVSVRLNDPTRDPVALIREQIESAAENDPVVELQRDPSAGDAGTADSSLWDLFAPLEVWRGNQLQQLVVVLDQFEELFTLGWNPTERRRFITQFGEVVRGHRLREDGTAGRDPHAAPLPPPVVKFVIVIREDSLGELEALATDVPQILRSRFRLGPLDPTQAEVAIRAPASADDDRLQSPRFSYTDDACREILDFLRATTERGNHVEGSAIDPSQLQLVCQYVERTIVPSKRPASPDEIVEVDTSDLGGRTGLQRVLADFYRRTLDSVPVGEQRAVRNLCERGLINTAGRRLSLEQGEIAATHEVSQQTLELLVDARLLRADPRVGSVYYELAHDTLVAPILAFREAEQARRTRRTRRIALLAGGVLAVVVLGVVAIFLVSRNRSDEVVARPLAAGQAVTTEIEEPGDVALFSIEPSPEPLLAVVSPSAAESGSSEIALPDVVVEYTTANGASHEVDELGQGAAELTLVPATGERGVLEVSAAGSFVGSLDVSLVDVAVTDLPDDGSVEGSIDAPGAVVVYAIDADEGSHTAIDVTPTPVPTGGGEGSGGGDQPAKDLDVRLELIDPTGAGSFVDENGSGQSEAAALGGTAGRYYVVIRGYETATGAFTIETRPDDFVLTVDEPKSGRIDAGSNAAEYVLDIADAGTYTVEVVPDSKLDPVLSIADPNGGTTDVDSGGADSPEFAVLGDEPGRYRITVSGFDVSTGGFTIEARRVENALVLGESRAGRIDAASDEAAFVFDVTGSGTFLIEVRPDADLDVVMHVADPFGGVRTIDDDLVGATEFDLVRETEGRHIVTVTGSGPSTGEFEILVEQIEVVPLTDGTVIGEGTTAYELPALADDEFIEVRAASDAGQVVDMRVTDESGFGFYQVEPSDPADTADVVLSGMEEAFGTQVVVRSDGAYEVTFETITPTLLPSGSTVTASSASAYAIRIAGDEIVELRAAPGPRDVVNLQVFDVDGFTVTESASTGPGEPASVILTGDVADGARVVVRAGGPYTVSLMPLPIQRVVSGDVVPAAGTTAYELDLVLDGTAVEVQVAPAAAEFVDIRVFDPSGYPYGDARSVRAGEPVSVLVESEFGSPQRVVVLATGEHTDSFLPSDEGLGGP